MNAASQSKIEAMQEGGEFSSKLRKALAERVKPGITTHSLEDYARVYFEKNNLKPSFLGYMDYPFHTVICVNEEVVHGMPSERIIQEGDIVTVDLGVYHKGYHTDTATTVEAGSQQVHRSFLQVGEVALKKAIAQCTAGNHIGDISHAMQTVVESNGYAVIRSFVGHGIGRELHEPVQIPCFGEPGDGLELSAGMTIAVEVMYVENSYKLDILDDGWTAVTHDKGMSAMFEHTIAITGGEPLILTE